MGGIIMRSNPHKVTKIKKKTRAQFFEDIEVGDVLIFQSSVRGPGRGRGTYAGTIVTMNQTKDTAKAKTPNQLDDILENFTLEEVIE